MTKPEGANIVVQLADIVGPTDLDENVNDNTYNTRARFNLAYIVLAQPIVQTPGVVQGTQLRTLCASN